MFCSRCGLRVEESDKFCQACGQEVGAAVLAAAVPTPSAAAVSAPPPPAGGAAPVSAPLPYAGFWVRFVAALIDGLILSIPFGLVLAVFIFLLGGFGLMMHRNPVEPREAAALAAPLILSFMLGGLFFIALEWLYFAGMESSARQATFGKSVMSLRVTSLEGRRISFGHATGRFFAKIVSGMIPLAIGYIMAGFTAKKQALHDMIAATLVLKK
jgi:uncharacterized RDD family membrane protein YckC